MIIKSNGVSYGPFTFVNVENDRLVTDTGEFPLSVIGTYEILPDDTIIAEKAAAALLNAKFRKNDEINKWREEANASYFEHAGKKIAFGAVDFKDISIMAGYVGLFNALPINFPGGWKTMDNGYVPISNVAAFKAFYTSLMNQGTANFGRSQFLKGKISTATTLEEIEVLKWEVEEEE